jgi:uncharacterized protein with von Willebrand factor type A (vWA) domain
MNDQTLSYHVVQFSRLLRERGIQTSAVEALDALRALEHVPLERYEAVKMCFRLIFARRQADCELVDAAFDAYFRADFQERRRLAATAERGEKQELPPRQNTQKPQNSGIQTLMDWLQPKEQSHEEQAETPFYSPMEALSKKDFGVLSEEEIHALKQTIEQMARRFVMKESRRTERTKKCQTLDMRHTVRQSLRFGGETLRLSYKRRKIEKLRLVLLCDVSKSMDVYSLFVMQFLIAFVRAVERVVRRAGGSVADEPRAQASLEIFCFSTSLHRLTHLVQSQNTAQTLKRLSERIPDWSGGTRIGACLDEFVHGFAPTLLTRKSIVLIMSDGWDTGEIDVLTSAMKELQRRSAAVIWLNPLAGSKDFEPTVQGMAAALPFVDVLAPAHNLESLNALCDMLRRRSFA